MKKVFISVPMKDRTKENIEKSIKKMKIIAVTYLEEEVEFVNTIVEEKPPYNNSNEAIWYLGKSIEILSQCDVLVTLNNCYNFKGCRIEKDIAIYYGLNIIELNFNLICPDVIKQYECKKKINPVDNENKY